MATATNQFSPDYAVPPGWVLQERLEVEGISHAKFARRCGRSPKLISEIISGKAPLEPGTALQFEKVLGVDASVWLGIESDYRLLPGSGG
jgi:HTH-type transcriptional regulator/antitoxin HigA